MLFRNFSVLYLVGVTLHELGLLHKEYRSVQFSHLAVFNSLRSPWTAAHQASLYITNSRSLLKFMSIKSLMDIHIDVDAIQQSHPLLFPSPPAFNLY